MKVMTVEVYVTEELAYRINMKSSFENAGRELLKSKLHRLVDKIVDESLLEEIPEGPNRKYKLKLAYDRKEKTK
jgi:hypothetical protein